MTYIPTWKERWEDARQYFLPAIAGVLVLAVGGWLLWFRYGPKPAKKPPAAATASELELNAARQAMAAEVQALDDSYRRAAELQAPDEALDRVLARLIEAQRNLMKLHPLVGPEQNERLTRYEAARGELRARAATARSRILEQEAAADQRAGRTAVAAEKLREALRLQGEANTNAVERQSKDIVRESRLALTLEEAASEPLRAVVDDAQRLASSAAAKENWPEALTAYRRARAAQVEINQRFAGQPAADLAAVNRLDTEIASIETIDTAAAIRTRERRGESALAAGDTKGAAADFAAAVELQRTLNENFPLSRFASASRAETLEVLRQTALSTETIARATALDREATQLLQRREHAAATTKIAEATALLEQAGDAYPRSRALDATLRTKLAYLALRAGGLGALQQEIDRATVPIPGEGKVRMFATEIPQDLYLRVMNANPSRHLGRTLPVDSVSWHEAVEFCQRLSWLCGVSVRLPAEKEFRAAFDSGAAAAWSRETANGHSHVVGTAKGDASPFHDLAGNLAEWLKPDATSAEIAPVAGGSFLDPIDSVSRLPIALTGKRERSRHIGFRVVVEPP